MTERRPAALITASEWRKPSIRFGVGAAHVLLLLLLVVAGLGPLLWLAKSAITPTNDTISHPMAFFSHGAAWHNLRDAWVNVGVGRYFWNSVVLAVGSWLVQIVVATTGGYALSVLRPRYAKLINGLLLTTLFVPAVVLILGVVSVFAVLASWKDFLWPLLVLADPNKQPLSVRLPTIQSQTELGVFLGAMFIACLVPVAGFLIFQRSFLRGNGLGGAIKG